MVRYRRYNDWKIKGDKRNGVFNGCCAADHGDASSADQHGDEHTDFCRDTDLFPPIGTDRIFWENVEKSGDQFYHESVHIHYARDSADAPADDGILRPAKQVSEEAYIDYQEVIKTIDMEFNLHLHIKTVCVDKSGSGRFVLGYDYEFKQNYNLNDL